ncbi:hypothetical protein CCACVL1_19151 [Corchorus capsularis]|uniref:Uncharacterized protein n=1 Tax=Corchorus capsularis TaxID=210143 RepID=A0A1R3HI21_COCAP|nr:hypothetical protein CCACVL1_19151 [Corchorus capsularis]
MVFDNSGKVVIGGPRWPALKDAAKIGGCS